MYRILLPFIFIYFAPLWMLAINPVRISTQKAFEAIVRQVNLGKEQNIVLSPGTYYLNQSINAKNRLSIKGSNATITMKEIVYSPLEAVRETNSHYVYRVKSAILPYSLFVTRNHKIVDVSESVDNHSKVNLISGDVIGPIDQYIGMDLKIPLAKNLLHLANMKLKIHTDISIVDGRKLILL